MQRIWVLMVGLGLAAVLPVAAVAGVPAGVKAKVASEAASASLLTGHWAGDEFSLRAIAGGAMVQGKCAVGKITQPITLDKSGGFVARGYFNPATSGYRLSDLTPRDHPARFNGQVKGDTLLLTIQTGDKAADRKFQLTRGKAIQFGKCT